MNDINTVQHDLKRDVHNILSLLKFIKSDEEIKDPEIKSMLNMSLDREGLICNQLNELCEYIKRVSHGI
jgi:hypothetical protein